jgi:excisionase family DNA binding protein
MYDDFKTKPTCNVEDAAALLGISRGAAYSAVSDGTIPNVRIGHRVRVLTAPLLAMLQVDNGESRVASCRGDSAG